MKNKINSGIYALYFEASDYRYYIGKSLDIYKRYNIHCRDLRNKVHHSYKLQQEYNIKGVYPTLYLLEEMSNITNINEKEIYWIIELEAYLLGFNVTGGGEGAGYGHTAPSAIYEEEIYITILYFLANTSYSCSSIAEELEVSMSVVTDISLGNSHKNLALQYPEVYAKMSEKHGNYASLRKYESQIYNSLLKDLANTSIKYNILANKYGISESIVEDIGRGATHKYLEQENPDLYAKMISKKGTRRSGPHSGNSYPPIKSPEGVIFYVSNAKQFALDNKLHPGHLGDVLRSTAKSHKGWILA
jgi:hypothetical protein